MPEQIAAKCLPCGGRGYFLLRDPSGEKGDERVACRNCAAGNPGETPPEPVKTLRDEFAMAAPEPPASWWDGGRVTCAGWAQWDYQFANAMMAARKEQP